MASWNMGVTGYNQSVGIGTAVHLERWANSRVRRHEDSGGHTDSGRITLVAELIIDDEMRSGYISFGTFKLLYSYEKKGVIQGSSEKAPTRRIPCGLSRVDAGN